MDRVVLRDFDGTLAERPGLWGACLFETLDEHEPGHAVEFDRLRSQLRDGFPWHRPHVAHPELCEADAWWAHVSRLLAAAYEGVGIVARPRRRARVARPRAVRRPLARLAALRRHAAGAGAAAGRGVAARDPLQPRAGAAGRVGCAATRACPRRLKT